MRAFMAENELVAVEVRQGQQVHTRNQLFGKLSHGLLVEVAPKFVRTTQHFVECYEGRLGVILGKNGCIWISGRREGAESAVIDPAKQDLSPAEILKVLEIKEFIEQQVVQNLPITFDIISENFK